MRRYANGDWVEIDAECQPQNNQRVETGGTIASIYRTPAGVKFYLITGPEPTLTTVLMPEEY